MKAQMMFQQQKSKRNITVNKDARPMTPINHSTYGIEGFQQVIIQQQVTENIAENSKLLPQFGLTSKLPESQKSVINMVQQVTQLTNSISQSKINHALAFQKLKEQLRSHQDHNRALSMQSKRKDHMCNVTEITKEQRNGINKGLHQMNGGHQELLEEFPNPSDQMSPICEDAGSGTEDNNRFRFSLMYKKLLFKIKNNDVSPSAKGAPKLTPQTVALTSPPLKDESYLRIFDRKHSGVPKHGALDQHNMISEMHPDLEESKANVNLNNSRQKSSIDELNSSYSNKNNNNINNIDELIGEQQIVEEESISNQNDHQESLMGTTQVKDCEELANAPIKTPLVSVPKSNFRLLAKNEEQERRSKSLEEINLSDKEKNLGRKKFWAGHSNLISNLDLHKLDDNHLAQETLLLKQGISSAFQVNKKSLGRGLASDNDIQSPDFISNNNSFTRQQFQAANGEEQKNIDDDLSRFRSQTPHRRFGNQNQTFQFNLKNRGCITPMNHNAIHLNGEKKQKALDLSHDARKTNVEDAWNQFQDIFLNAIKKQTNSKNIEEERKESKKSKEWQVIYKPSRNSNQNNRDSCQEDNNKIETPDGKEDMQFSFKICGLDLLAFKTKTNQVNQNQVMDAEIQENYKTIKFLHYLPTCQAQVLDERNSQGHEDSQFFHQLKKENMQNDTIQTDFKRWIVKLRLTEQLQRSFYAKDRPQALEIVEEINKIIKAGNNYPEVFKFNQRFNIHGMPIGEGAFGKVYKGYDCIDQKNQSAVAIKEVLIDTKNRMIAEIQMEECDICYFLMKYPHPNVMQFKNLILYNNEIKVAMEYIRGQDMNQWAIQIHNEGRYSERLIKKVFFQVCQGVHHLHIHGIVHRDIKLENILVSLDDQGEPQIKVLDFGLASIVFQGQVILRPCGSLAFSSPEIVRKTFYDQKTDVWSLGVVLYCILTQRLPFFRINPDETKYNILKQEITFTSKHWAVISPKAKDLISKMLCKDASQRISIDEVVQHPWFDVLNNK